MMPIKHRGGRWGTITQHPQADFSITDSESYKPSLLAGTSKGLWLLDAQPCLELEGLPLTRSRPVTMAYGRSSITTPSGIAISTGNGIKSLRLRTCG
jgi:hypothetical protein